ncbi:replication protein [Acinetobacter ursingii]|uniref:replication protein n=1 Tax=Acinetobacter ursingii TaxID=108980 RepID=UPI0021CD4060|nr:replication protein [Acinetobacter ursingii]MCU4589122.1 replication protein [Acinetobacter ursingii]
MNIGFDLDKYLKQATPVEDKYTRTPNYLVDKGYVSEMTGSALKCYFVISRFTDGFSRSNWSLTSNFLQEKTGIKKLKTLTDSVRQLEQLGLIIVQRSTGETNKFSIIHPEFELPTKMDGSTENGWETTPENGTGSTHQNGGETTPENGATKKETNKKENIKKDICEIFEFWKTTFSKNEKTILSDKRAKKIQARLVDGYLVEDIKHAILNCSKSDYHVQGGYTDIELICREPEKLDRFIGLFPQPQQANETPTTPDSQLDYGAW